MPNSLQIPPYRAALLTGADGAPVIRSNGPDSELVMTERQWYMFWQNLAGQINANTQALEGLGNIVTFGNHADRPDAGPWPDGALYVEWDRGSVLYQNQGGIWVYIAGQMFGTLSPDQRPADLGMPDAGFAFRTNVDPARSFAWSGTAWIETTPIRYGTNAARLAEVTANLVSGMFWTETDRGNVVWQNQGGTWVQTAAAAPYVYAAGSVPSITLTTTPQDIPGLTLTLPKAGIYHVSAVYDLMILGADASVYLFGQLVNPAGAVAPRQAILFNSSTGTRASVAQQWSVTATAAGQTIKSQAYKSGGTGSSLVTDASTLAAIWVSP